MTTLLITGGSGFIGKALCKRLKPYDYLLHVSSRKNISTNSEKVVAFNTGEINKETRWTDALTGVDCIIHCAGRAHITEELSKNLLDIYRKVNVDGTINLANQAVKCGVKRMIFLSSIKVNGEKTQGLSKYVYNDVPCPEDAYGISKWEAEKSLWEVSKQTGLEVVIIRPTLVYGYGVKGNLKRLIKLINYGIPLPLKSINNLRSLIGIDNLVDIIICCIDNPDANGKTFLVSDGEDLSTPDLIDRMALAMGRSVKLFPFPIFLIKLISSLIGKNSEVNRLVGSLQVDSKYVREILDWKPSTSVDEGFRRMFGGD